MSEQQTLDRVHVKQLSATKFTPPNGSIDNDAVKANAKIEASKLQHRWAPTYQQAGAANAAAERKVAHVVYGAAGTLLAFSIGARVAATGNATVTVDLHKNGASVLTGGAIVLDSTTAAYDLASAPGFTSDTLAAGDVLEVVVTAPAAGTGTLAQGLFAQVVLNEDAV